MMSTDSKKRETKEKSMKVYPVNLDDIPNGRRKPIEACAFINKMKTWREESARSTLLIR